MGFLKDRCYLRLPRRPQTVDMNGSHRCNGKHCHVTGPAGDTGASVFCKLPYQPLLGSPEASHACWQTHAFLLGAASPPLWSRCGASWTCRCGLRTWELQGSLWPSSEKAFPLGLPSLRFRVFHFWQSLRQDILKDSHKRPEDSLTRKNKTTTLKINR